MTAITWPGGAKFAFSIFDDTDHAVLANVNRTYALLRDLGFRTTKSVWPERGPRVPVIGGTTCEDPDYLRWLRELQGDGFEIGYHNNTFHTSVRDETLRGLERFRECFGHYPHSMANHFDCEDSIYWGNHRFTGVHRTIYNLLTRHTNENVFGGHVEGHPTFWGDACARHVKYVRNFTYADVNTLKACPQMPYHDPDRPYVKYWYASSDGSNVQAFNRCLSEEHQDRLEEQGGACIMYTHFAFGFQEGTHLNQRFKELMERFSRKSGYFAPVHTLLDHILAVRGHRDITQGERSGLERRWLLDRVLLEARRRLRAL